MKSQKPTNIFANDFLNIGILVIALTAAFIALRSVTSAPMNDDFSYAHTARVFAQTGRIVYNGWGSPALFPQALYGALLIRIFGFSYVPLQVSGIVFAIGVCIALYMLCRSVGCKPSWSAFVTSLLVFNPVFIMNAPSFMTDIPSLLLLIVSLLLLFRSVKNDAAGKITISPRLFYISVVVAIVAGSNRQIAWLAYLSSVCVLILAVPSRRERVPLLLGAASIALVILTMTFWYQKQNYIVPVNFSAGWDVFLFWPQRAVCNITRFFNQLGVFTFPLTILCLPIIINSRKLLLLTRAATIVYALPLFVFYNPASTGYTVIHFGVPQYGNYFTSVGPFVGGATGILSRHDMINLPFAGTLYILGSLSLAITTVLGIKAFRDYRSYIQGFRHMSRNEIVAFAMLISAFSQVLISFSWYAEGAIFDRYLLLLIPGVFIPLAIFIQSENESVVLPVNKLARTSCLVTSFVAGGLLVGIGAAFANTYFNESHARRDLYTQLLRKNVKRQHIDAGFEYNGDTQVSTAGFVNSPLMVNVPHPLPENIESKYLTMFRGWFPSMDAYFRMVTDESTQRARFGVFVPPVATIRYRSLLPPFQRSISAYRIIREEDQRQLEKNAQVKRKAVHSETLK